MERVIRFCHRKSHMVKRPRSDVRLSGLHNPKLQQNSFKYRSESTRKRDTSRLVVSRVRHGKYETTTLRATRVPEYFASQHLQVLDDSIVCVHHLKCSNSRFVHDRVFLCTQGGGGGISLPLRPLIVGCRPLEPRLLRHSGLWELD